MLGTKCLGARVEGDVVKLTVEPSKGGEQQELDANIVLVSAGTPGFPYSPSRLIVITVYHYLYYCSRYIFTFIIVLSIVIVLLKCGITTITVIVLLLV